MAGESQHFDQKRIHFDDLSGISIKDENAVLSSLKEPTVPDLRSNFRLFCKFALGNVPETPDSADYMVPDFLGFWITFKDFSIIKFDHVKAFAWRMYKELLDAGKKSFGSFNLREDMIHYCFVFPRFHQSHGDIQHVHKILVITSYPALLVDHIDTVRGWFKSCIEEWQGFFKRCIG